MIAGTSRYLVASLVALGLGAALTACKGDAQGDEADPGADADHGDAPIAVDPPVAEVGNAPDTEEAFLRRLVPLPSPAIEVVYDVTGPAGLEGELRLWVRPGGWRREAWTLRVPMPGREAPDESAVVTKVTGLTIQTPDRIWTAVGDEVGTVTQNRIGDLAEAYLALDPTARVDVISALDGWYARLDAARDDAPGQRKTVAGLDCLQTRVAAQNVCLWESAGLPLTYQGSEFSLRAVKVDRSPELPDDAFELPSRAANAEAVPIPKSLELDPEAAVKKLANGDYAPLALVLTPGFRVPSSGRAG